DRSRRRLCTEGRAVPAGGIVTSGRCVGVRIFVMAVQSRAEEAFLGSGRSAIPILISAQLCVHFVKLCVELLACLVAVSMSSGFRGAAAAKFDTEFHEVGQ